jgi:hypothetical protein
MNVALSQFQGRLFLILGLLFLISCTTDVKPPEYQTQRTFFLNGIEQVQQASALLQKNNATSAELTQAMALLDKAMMNVNSVEVSFLKWLDAGLYQAFTAYLAKGIENYRLGVELEDREQQAKGIELLQRWWGVWQLKKPAVLIKLDATV